jgi:SWI/SNF chromatin-remodeling complex subunit SWI1
MSAVGAEQHMPRMPPKPEDYSPCARELSTYGGIDLHAANLLGAELERWEPTVPSINELGNIDIAALTCSLQCGIQGEVRLALDSLVTISSSPNQTHFLHLRGCDDLIEALVDCAETQVDLLVEHTVEVADEIQLGAYEDVVRSCRIDRWAVRDVPAVGSIGYELDRAVDRLICITTILRNVSFPGENNDNHLLLCEESVIKMLCSVIRYLGTRTMLLRTHANTLDFMKDIVVLLSNISSQLEIPGREQALSLLQFLLAFAPVPGPIMTNNTLSFSSYDPSIHTYLPHAVDALAKLLARDEPNRGFYKALFTVDSSSPLASELLIRTFALATSPLPDRAKEQFRPTSFPPLFETRKPFLMQGLLAAEIIASLVPGSEPGIARALLASGNCLAQNLIRLIQELSMLYEKPPPPTRGANRAAAARKDPELVYIVVVAVSLLRRLAEKARDATGTTSSDMGDLLPQPHMLMDALMMQSPEWTKEGLIPQLTAVLNLDG